MAKGTIRGQGKPKDAVTALFWRDPDNFAEVFSKTALKGCNIDPQDLADEDTSEETLLKVLDGAHITLKQIRDVVKSLKTGEKLIIMGIENQDYIDYMMPFRVWALDFINVARQISVIQNKHKNDKDISEPDEYVSGFKKDDRINGVITLVIYYGEKPWDGPTKLSDMISDSPYKPFIADYPMHLLDVRRMPDDEINEFSDKIRPLFGFLKYEKTDKLVDYVNTNEDIFSDLPPETFDTLMEITHSPELERFGKEARTAKGGVNMCYGIQVYAQKYAREHAAEYAKSAVDEATVKTFVEAAQVFGQNITATIEAFKAKFNVSDEIAEEDVKKYWKQ